MPKPAKSVQNSLLGADDVAARLGCSLPMAKRLMTTRVLPVVRVGRLTRVKPADLEAYIERNTETSIGERDRTRQGVRRASRS